MKSKPSVFRLLILVVLLVFGSTMGSRTFAQVTIPTGGFTTTTTCSSSNIIAGCQVATNGNAAPTSGGVLRLTPSTTNQIASVWALSPQTVSNGFTTTFTFQFTNGSSIPGDGIAFVIHNAQLTNNSNPLTTIGFTLGSGRNGGAIGYGDDDNDSFPDSGIPNSIAIELDTYANGWDNNANHVAVQSCGQGYNTSHHGSLCPGGGPSTLGISSSMPISLTDGNVHTVTIQYNPPNTTPCDPSTPTAQLCVYLDKTATSTPVVAVATDISSIGLTDGTAYMGFTSATGGSWETHDVLSWSYTQTVTVPLSTTGVTPLVFNNTPDQTITHTLDYSNAGTVETPLTNPQIQSTNVVVSDTTDWPPYVIGTPYAVSHIFPKNGDAAIGGTGTGLKGSIFKNACFDATHPPADANCPIATGANNFIGVADTFDVTAKPVIAVGTTTALIEYRSETVPSVTDWTASGSAPNPACSNTLGSNTSNAPAGCDLLDILVNTYGDATTVSGTTKKKGTFASVYGVPMPLTSVSVNGTALNNSPFNNNDTSGLWFKSPLNLTFTVNPACPTNNYPCTADPLTYNYFSAAPVASESYLFTDPGGNPLGTTAQANPPTGYTTTSVVQVPFTASSSLADGKYKLQFSAADNVGIVERQVQLITATGATCPNPDPPAIPTPSPCYQTTLFQSRVNVDSTPPAANCQSADGLWHASDVSLPCTASDLTSGIGTALGVTPPAPAGPGATVSFNLQTNTPAGTANGNATTNTEMICDLANNCTNAVVTGNKIDKAFPTVGTITFAPTGSSYTVGQKVTATFSCADVGSGPASCLGTGSIASGGFIDTGAAGPHLFAVKAVDVAGNTTTSPAVPYTVVAAAADLFLTEIPLAPDSIKMGKTGNFYAGVVNLSSPTATNVVITTSFTAPSGVINGSVTASFGLVGCNIRGCSVVPNSGSSCSVSGTTITCNVGQLGSVQATGKGVVVKVNIPVAATAVVNTKFSSLTTVTSANDPKNSNNSYLENYAVTK
jgi:hypothetical protein